MPRQERVAVSADNLIVGRNGQYEKVDRYESRKNALQAGWLPNCILVLAFKVGLILYRRPQQHALERRCKTAERCSRG
jgi:hypothetical protein